LNRELPSGLLRHSVSSGCATYVIHSQSRWNIGLARGHAWKVDRECLRLSIESDQIKAPLLPDHE